MNTLKLLFHTYQDADIPLYRTKTQIADHPGKNLYSFFFEHDKNY